MILAFFSCQASSKTENVQTMKNLNKNQNVATLGGGCFWCIEAVFEELKGIESAINGYSGGDIKNPSYREVTTGRTGHAEVVQITFNPEIITYRQILEVFFHLHDPTTLNRQGADVGTQYRSVIYYHDQEQKETAEKVFKETDESDLWENPLVTEIAPMGNFYVAEDYHQDYFAKNPNQAYCTYVISPKMTKLRKLFKEKLKE